MSNASFKMNGVEVFSENAQTVTVKNINVAANDTTTPSMAKAWVNFDGALAMTVNSSYGPDAPPADYSSPNPIHAAYNVDYIIDRGTGDYEIHFENAMPDGNYVVAGATSDDNRHQRLIMCKSDSIASGSVRIGIVYSDGGLLTDDTGHVMIGIFR
ncbi:MAG: hypothetical protein CBC12_10685 [Candidatus Puniceispirillum sp. TMED52]|nr:MAG: hypothetical protein CBC12_10685 [Candidatus Puniceispirillum sp. TMED52]|tara:strand:- start:246 stop:713 length:468 start_codon:yes stop_codon:yes gene_type:complete